MDFSVHQHTFLSIIIILKENLLCDCRYVDWVSIMTYDFHGKWESRTGHNSPLYPRGDEQGSARHLNMVCTLCLSNISEKLRNVNCTCQISVI